MSWSSFKRLMDATEYKYEKYIEDNGVEQAIKQYGSLDKLKDYLLQTIIDEIGDKQIEQWEANQAQLAEDFYNSL